MAMTGGAGHGPVRGLPARSGLALAAATAAVSGVSVFVNSYGVKAFHQAAVYTTAKNLVAAALLAGGAGALRSRRGRRPVPPGRGGRPLGPVARRAGLAYVAAVGGGAAFILFFDGLAASAAVPAAFIRDTLVIWVGLLALPWLGERVSLWNLAAVGLLVTGQAAAGGGIGHLVAGRGAALVLASTVLWAGEVVVARRLLADVAPGRLGVVRMGGGVVVLLGYLAVTGHLRTLGGLTAAQTGWALVTGALLAAYVAAWMGALARARALDVTSVLVASAVITAVLNAVTGKASLAPQALGLTLVAVGTALVVRLWARSRSAPGGGAGAGAPEAA